jgi:hypothetical protein
LKYICVRCKHTWSVNNDNHGLVKLFLLYLQERWKNDPCPYSGGVCESCITEYIRGRQRERGFDDCFKRAIEMCGRGECSYHDLCCNGIKGKEEFL